MNFEGGRLLNDGTYMSNDQSDAALFVRFFLHPVKDEKRSEEEGIPKYIEIEMIEILSPGNKDKFCGRATDHYKQRFPKQYSRFKEKMDEGTNGTPLNQFPFITASDIKELEYFNVFTAEQLINMPDGNIDKIGVNGRNLIKQVKAYIEAAKDSSVLPRLVSENEKLKGEIELLKKQMSQFLANQPEVNIDERRHDRKSRKSQAQPA